MIGGRASDFSLQTKYTFPPPPSTRTRCPFFSRLKDSFTDITAGMRISRAVTAPCESGPPLSVTTATVNPRAVSETGIVFGKMVGAVRFELTLPVAHFPSKTAIFRQILGFLYCAR